MEQCEPWIWIVGDSYVRRGRDRAANTVGVNLWLAAHLRWIGRGGLRWREMVPMLLWELRQRSVPAVLLICCGSNDLRKEKSVDMVATMKRDLPDLKILLSELTDRRLWRAAKPGRIQRAKKCVNNVLKAFIVDMGGAALTYL
ncbi:hypothetical protein WMY93_022809 [Mugilogobius chulae]|uniref:SGNH hydrolase-type esterase domain-containing protein n=1 Tax=Mugilogobius chulae TaxID=88201 RepID=A0AAW0NJ46_9GOBI